MQNRVPVPREQRAPLPDFAPVPRQYRHDGWTPARQRAFIEALADTGSVMTACRMVNMSQVGAYYLRRQPGAEGFRRAWEAALDFGVQRLKDEAFERAINGQLVPVFVGGRLHGFRRKKNDRLLMFCLRHYGQDANGRRVTINYFSTRASAAAASNSSPAFAGEGDHVKHGGGGEHGGHAGGMVPARSGALAEAEASTTTVKTVISGSAQSKLEADDQRVLLINDFPPAELDEQAQAEIQRVLEACATRRRALQETPEHDPECTFIRADPAKGIDYVGELESGAEFDDFIPCNEPGPEQSRRGELSWQGMGEGGENAEIEKVLAAMERHQIAPPGMGEGEGQSWADEDAATQIRAEIEQQTGSGKSPTAPSADPEFDPFDWRNYK